MPARTIAKPAANKRFSLSLRPAQWAEWRRLFLLTALAASGYVFFEWLFIATKPSFLSILVFSKKVEILLVSMLLLSALTAWLLAPLVLISRLKVIQRWSGVILAAGALLPALILGALSLLMIDNFTYTVFKFGIVTARPPARVAYAVLLIAVTAIWQHSVLEKSRDVPPETELPKANRWGILGLLLVCLIPIALAAGWRISQRRPDSASAARPANRPNIVMVTGDGINAENVSVYGYARDTTPNLTRLAKKSLVADNAFANAGSTAGSLISLYTGKSPAHLRVLYAPDVLRGEDAYQHLPGILKAQGYYTEQISLLHYADAYNFNLVDGFDRANGVDAHAIGGLTALHEFLPADYAYFAAELYQRVTERILHIFFLAEMRDPYAAVLRPSKFYEENSKIAATVGRLKTSDRPVFMHIHLMATHGPTFGLSRQRFSAGKSLDNQEDWDVDFYDDAIREFDRMVGELVRGLTIRGQLDHTILIIGSDHGTQWSPLHRMPLLIRFPKGEYKRRIQVNVQNMDVAPTILDYLGLEKPAWMEGESLLRLPSEPRLIFTTMVITTRTSNQELLETDSSKVKPPFYQFESISVIDCQKWRRIRLNDLSWDYGEIPGYVSPCPESQLMSDEEALQALVEYLKSNDFDVSSLEGISKVAAGVRLQSAANP